MPDVLAERRRLPPEEAAPGAGGPRPRGLHGRRGLAPAAGGVAPREERARLVDGDPHCDFDGRRFWAVGRFELALGPGAGGWGGARRGSERASGEARGSGLNNRRRCGDERDEEGRVGWSTGAGGGGASSSIYGGRTRKLVLLPASASFPVRGRQAFRRSRFVRKALAHRIVEIRSPPMPTVTYTLPG
jgi:hypothetical protein